MLPPSEKPIIENVAEPVHEMGEEAVAKRICIPKSLESYGTSKGVSE